MIQMMDTVSAFKLIRIVRLATFSIFSSFLESCQAVSFQPN